MAEPVEVAETQELEAPEVAPEVAPEKEKPKKAAKPKAPLPKEAPEEITLQTPDGPVTFTKKRPVGRPKKEPKPKARAKKVVVRAPAEILPSEESAPPEKENEVPPAQPPLVRMSGREKLEEHMRVMQELRCNAKESQRVKYRAMLRA